MPCAAFERGALCLYLQTCSKINYYKNEFTEEAYKFLYAPGPSISACISVISSSRGKNLTPSGGLRASCLSSFRILVVTWGGKFSRRETVLYKKWIAE
jgi:hypothetical protein